ncbi:hypothetical protein NP493_529g00028 [Ridgeia piscesae]|uniref:Uncharacterized protein n=1 Tax=Ridgeia piscesae TaxID=27915 RepID=A0AAD9NS95_RIDPI|nr:hypothetical protein NP493_529g00028 [Ridgeia piscesae]
MTSASLLSLRGISSESTDVVIVASCSKLSRDTDEGNPRSSESVMMPVLLTLCTIWHDASTLSESADLCMAPSESTDFCMMLSESTDRCMLTSSRESADACIGSSGFCAAINSPSMAVSPCGTSWSVSPVLGHGSMGWSNSKDSADMAMTESWSWRESVSSGPDRLADSLSWRESASTSCVCISAGTSTPSAFLSPDRLCL